MFSDGVFSYGIEPVSNGSTQVRQLNPRIRLAGMKRSDATAVFCPHRMAHISFAGCLILDFLLTVQVLTFTVHRKNGGSIFI